MKFTNQLIKETSPYLLQHAHNPVDWYPWCEEALEKARKEDKLILVSIGYSACHWCHVMERESFEDEHTAYLMNQHFVSIKIDREERPDLDHFFMDALQAISGQGGWPLNMFLTPDGKPFYGGTYFPPVAMHQRISWKELLVQLHDAFLKRRSEIEAQANQLLEHLQKTNRFEYTSTLEIDLPVEEKFTEQQAHKIFDQIMASADRVEGGFGNAPKFPQTYSIQYLLRYHHFFKNSEALDQALLSLKKMLRGGIYDQVGGGFCRYSTDAKWFAPHFEKMAYDNALLLTVLTEAYQICKDSEIKQVVFETVDFIKRELLSSEHGFYAALDADSEGEEGKYYTWKKEEFTNVLGDHAAMMADYFNIQENGNWEHTNILFVRHSIEEWAKEKQIEQKEARIDIGESKKKLLTARERRVKPGLDDKIILGWNALLSAALAHASIVFEQTEWRELAKENTDFLRKYFFNEEKQIWKHTYKNGEAKFPAFLDDLAYLIQSLLLLHEATGEIDYLKQARQVLEYVLHHFSDAQGVYFYYSPDFHGDVSVRKIDVYDGATPSGNSIMSWNLHRFSVLFEVPEWRIRAEKMLEGMQHTLVKYPTSFGKWASQLLEMTQGIHEVAVVGEDPQKGAAELLSHFVPNKVVVIGKKESDEFPLLKGRSVEKKVAFYVCKQYVCQAPVQTPEKALTLLLTKS
jgi:uncharacterized protein